MKLQERPQDFLVVATCHACWPTPEHDCCKVVVKTREGGQASLVPLPLWSVLPAIWALQGNPRPVILIAREEAVDQFVGEGIKGADIGAGSRAGAGGDEGFLTHLD